jgi:hypothetical protein
VNGGLAPHCPLHEGKLGSGREYVKYFPMDRRRISQQGARYGRKVASSTQSKRGEVFPSTRRTNATPTRPG